MSSMSQAKPSGYCINEKKPPGKRASQTKPWTRRLKRPVRGGMMKLHEHRSSWKWSLVTKRKKEKGKRKKKKSQNRRQKKIQANISQPSAPALPEDQMPTISPESWQHHEWNPVLRHTEKKKEKEVGWKRVKRRKYERGHSVINVEQVVVKVLV